MCLRITACVASLCHLSSSECASISFFSTILFPHQQDSEVSARLSCLELVLFLFLFYLSWVLAMWSRMSQICPIRLLLCSGPSSGLGSQEAVFGEQHSGPAMSVWYTWADRGRRFQLDCCCCDQLLNDGLVQRVSWSVVPSLLIAWSDYVCQRVWVVVGSSHQLTSCAWSTLCDLCSSCACFALGDRVSSWNSLCTPICWWEQYCISWLSTCLIRAESIMAQWNLYADMKLGMILDVEKHNYFGETLWWVLCEVAFRRKYLK